MFFVFSSNILMAPPLLSPSFSSPDMVSYFLLQSNSSLNFWRRSCSFLLGWSSCSSVLLDLNLRKEMTELWSWGPTLRGIVMGFLSSPVKACSSGRSQLSSCSGYTFRTLKYLLFSDFFVFTSCGCSFDSIFLSYLLSNSTSFCWFSTKTVKWRLSTERLRTLSISDLTVCCRWFLPLCCFCWRRALMQGLEASRAQTRQQTRCMVLGRGRDKMQEHRQAYQQTSKFILLVMQQLEIWCMQLSWKCAEPSPHRCFQTANMKYRDAWSTCMLGVNYFISRGKRICLSWWVQMICSKLQIQCSALETSSPSTVKLTLSSIYYTTHYILTYLMQCCPKGSWPQLAVDYHPKGQTKNVEGVSIYHVGEGHKPLLIISDIFGATSSRHQVVADIFASWGYNVFLPQILNPPFTGEDFQLMFANIKGQNVQGMEGTFNKVVSYLKHQGIQKFLCVGFCWGVWFGFRMAAKYDCFKAIVGPHPSIALEKMVYGSSEMELAEKVKCPAYFLPAGNDGPNVKEKGEVVELLAKRFGAELTGSTSYPQMMHGWVVRGDLKDEKVSRDFHGAMHVIQGYLAKFK